MRRERADAVRRSTRRGKVEAEEGVRTARVDEAAEATEGVVRRVAERYDFLKSCVEVCRGQMHAVRGERLVKSGVEGD